jgi:type I restriction enzyme S subunit
MPSDWRTTTLGECADFFSGGTPRKSNPAYWDGHIPWFSGKDLKSFYLTDSEDHVTKEGAEAGSRLMPPKTILLLVRGMTLHNDVPIGVLKREATFNQDIKALRAKKGVQQLFLAHWLVSQKPRLLQTVHAAGHGTGVLATDRLQALELELPSPGEQAAIAKVFDLIEEKIEHNRRTGRALEALARATFKAWFVDFEPVKAKAAGQTSFPGMPPAAFTALPNRLTDSPIGQVPEGWEEKTAGEVIKRLPVGKKFDQKTVKPVGAIPVLDQSVDGVIGYHDEAPGVFASVAAPVAVFANHTCNMGLHHKSFSTIQNVLPFVGESVNTLWAYFGLLNRQKFIEYKGHWPDFILQKLVVPPQPLTDFYGDIVRDLIKLKWVLEAESTKLAALRDYLLPLLLSGQVRVKGRVLLNGGGS